MDVQRTNREGGGVLKTVGVATASFSITAIAVTYLRGTLRDNLPYIVVFGLILLPLATWGALLAKQYLFPTR
jgi:hypothetical protein